MTTAISMSIRKGTSPTMIFDVTDGDGPKNLTGAEDILFAIARNGDAVSRDLLLTLAGSPTQISHDGTGGTVTVEITKVQTEALPVGARWCELWITDLNGKTDLVAAGPCVVHDTLITVAA